VLIDREGIVRASDFPIGSEHAVEPIAGSLL